MQNLSYGKDIDLHEDEPVGGARIHNEWFRRKTCLDNREVKHDVYGKRQTAKMKLLPSVFSALYSRIKTFVFAVNSKRHFSIFV